MITECKALAVLIFQWNIYIFYVVIFVAGVSAVVLCKHVGVDNWCCVDRAII